MSRPASRRAQPTARAPSPAPARTPRESHAPSRTATGGVTDSGAPPQYKTPVPNILINSSKLVAGPVVNARRPSSAKRMAITYTICGRTGGNKAKRPANWRTHGPWGDTHSVGVWPLRASARTNRRWAWRCDTTRCALLATCAGSSIGIKNPGMADSGLGCQRRCTPRI